METLVAILRSFKPITEEQAAIILSAFQSRKIKEGGFVFKGGKVCRELYFIVSGVLRVVSNTDKGTDLTYYFMRDGQFCTILQSFDEASVTQDSIQACCDSDLLSISKKDLLLLYQQLPFMTDLMLQVHQQRLLEKVRLKNAYAGASAAERYRIFLAEQPEIAHRVPLNHIASYLNVTPQSLSRIRRAK